MLLQTVTCSKDVPLPAAVTAIDYCSGATVPVTYTDVISGQTCADRYIITRTWTATDACGNKATASQTIKVYNDKPPVLSGVPADVVSSSKGIYQIMHIFNLQRFYI